MDAETARLRGGGAERARFDAKRGNAAKKARQRGMWAPFGIPQRLTLEMKSAWHSRVTAHPCNQRWLSSGANASGSRAAVEASTFWLGVLYEEWYDTHPKTQVRTQPVSPTRL